MNKFKVDPSDIGKGILMGIVAGVLWGWISGMVNYMTGAFVFEENFMHELLTFAVGGGVFGMVVGGLLGVLNSILPFKGAVTKALSVSVGVWLSQAIIAFVLTIYDPIRYNFEGEQAAQGLLLSVVLGVILGLLWKQGGSKTGTTLRFVG